LPLIVVFTPTQSSKRGASEVTSHKEYLDRRWTALILLCVAQFIVVDGFRHAFLGGAVIGLLGFVATLVLIRTRDSRAHLEMARAQAPPAPATAG
jgi:hypothetical protein